MDEELHETVHIGVLRDQRPIEPTILAVSAVVTVLGAAHLIAHADHGHAEGEHRAGQQILDLPVPQCVHSGIVGQTFNPAVPASIVIGAIAVGFAVSLVALHVVGDQVVEGKSVMASHEIDAHLSLALLMPVDLRTAEQPVRDLRHRARIPSKEAADIVPEPPVPFPPVIPAEASHLVQTGRIPRLGDHFRARQHGIGFDVPEHRRVEDGLARRIAREYRRQVDLLLDRGCLWNTFVTIGHASVFLELLRSQIPDVISHLAAGVAHDNLDARYRVVRAADFSREVLTPLPHRLLVVHDTASGWADLGNPKRVIDTLVRNRIEPAWLEEMLVTRRAGYLLKGS
jgi:hypothetical protein